ncbi:ABC transporter ATP-binding protein [Xanthomonadaceae bacterium XH05]|nr:ABC transporter ATP-binding protein [Xanthomonadaceae bacterium XH05]
MTPLLSLHAVHLSYGAMPVLRGVDFSMQAGELVGLIGPNGSGKSSLLRACTGRVPCTGHLAIHGIDPRTDPIAARMQLGYAVDPATLPDVLRGRQCIELVAGIRQLDTLAIDQAEALANALDLMPWLDHDVGSYSLGTRQKLAVVLALLGSPPLLLLDEVLNGLDPLAAFTLKRILRERADAGSAVLLATHGLNVAEHFLDRAVLLLDGRIAADWPRAELDRLRRAEGGLEAAVVERLRALR